MKISGSNNTFHYYQKGEFLGPVVVFLHGGGFSGLTWALLSQSLSGLVECCCIALDQRGHGLTSTEDDLSLTADQLADDVGEVVKTVLHGSSSSMSPVILVGHSMGGAIAVHAAAKEKVPNLVGLVVIDVVEGSALESLHAMRGVLSNRPKSFESIEKANEWCIKTGYVRNQESARVSMAGQLRKLNTSIENNDICTTEETTTSNNGTMESINEDEESPKGPSSMSDSLTKYTGLKINPKHQYTWRIDLSKTSKFWEGWFKGMSSMFLSVSAPKLLLLAGVDRLDAQMTTAQMQGKFQMQIVARSGHAVHEDAPDKVAEVIASFLIRHKFAEPLGDFKRPLPAC